MDEAFERVLGACKSNCVAFQATVGTRAVTLAPELSRRLPPIAGG
jgi:hypothetical protein